MRQKPPRILICATHEPFPIKLKSLETLARMHPNAPTLKIEALKVDNLKIDRAENRLADLDLLLDFPMYNI